MTLLLAQIRLKRTAFLVLVLAIGFVFDLNGEESVTAVPSQAETIAHLNDVIAALLRQNDSLRKQLEGVRAELAAPAQDQESFAKLRGHIAKLQAECSAKDQDLAINQGSGGLLYAPDEKGLPYCIARLKPEEAKKK